MANAGAIRAGAAYVEVFLEQNPITRGLSALQARLRGWSASLGQIGSGAYGGELPGPLAAIARFASSPAGMFAGLLTAAKTAASSGAGMAELAEKAGTSVEAISALAYAARKAHVDSDNLAVGIKNMQRSITDAARGGKQGQEALAGVGMTAAELGRLLPEEQFRRIADRIAAIENPTERAAAAVKLFGRFGTNLLPLLLQGSDGIARWEGRARALGLVMNGEAAEGARRFDQLLGDLHDTLMSGVRVIGGAIIPELTSFVNWIIKGTAAARDWIKDHKGIVVTALQVTGAIVAGGLAFSVLSTILRNAASAINLVLVPLRLLSGLASGLLSISASIAAGIAGAAWSAAAWVAHAAWAGFGLLGSGLGLVFSAAAGITSLAWTAVATAAGVAWSAASLIASAAWVAGSVVVSGAWSMLSAVPAALAVAWSAAAAIASAAWTAVALALDTILTFAATGAMALPALIVAGIVAGLALLAAEIYMQLQKAFSSAGQAAVTTLPAATEKAAREAGRAASGGLIESFTSGLSGFGSTVSGWVTSALGGIGGVINGAAATFGNLMSWLKGVFNGLADDAQKTFGGISDALAAGDITLAAKVLWAMLKLEWQKGLSFLEGQWEGFKGFWNDAVIGLAMIFTNATAKVKTLWAEMIGWMEKKWNAFKLSGFTETLASWFAPIFARLQGVSVEDTQKALTEDFARGRRAEPKKDADIDAATKAKTDEIERERKGTEDELAKDKLRADKERQGRIDAAQADVAAARKELDDAVGTAREARDKAAAGGPESPGYVPPGSIPDINNLAAAKTSVEGTFSGYALPGLGGASSVEEKMEGHLARISENTDRQNAALERLERNMGDGMMLA